MPKIDGGYLQSYPHNSIYNIEGDVTVAVTPDATISFSGGTATPTNMLDTITQGLATFDFDTTYEVGQFVNGDYFVIDPGSGVNIISITPSSSSSGTTVNGAQINPDPEVNTQGFNQRATEVAYNASLNVAADVDSGNPLVLSAGDSLVLGIDCPQGSTYDTDPTKSNPEINPAYVLTVLSSVPEVDSFRPPYAYSSTGKVPQFTKADLNYSVLANVTPESGAPTIASQVAKIDAVWLNHSRYRQMGEIRANPVNWYAAYAHRELGVAGLMLNCNYTQQEKEQLMIPLVQIGIDYYGILINGGADNWIPNGGHDQGALFPILFAGKVLNDADMMAVRTTTYDHVAQDEFYTSFADNQPAWFQEIAQYFYVEETSSGVYNYGVGGYTANEVGMPEWGWQHGFDYAQDDRDWHSSDEQTRYRICCTARHLGAGLLASELMGIKTLWNHDAIFDYMERYFDIHEYEGDYGSYRMYPIWAGDMYAVHHTHSSTTPAEWAATIF